ncbi:hypothetical protein NEPAR06_1446 [Nematocida parisii]|uniref:Trimethylguanosine synthase n=1 Tax=Nematocida parisii (strain ERTm3) TaxID=935791 RepID=I3EEH0_NEMP3|nr:uncharacterized protein NEPG_02244 [Nematocida parisii ERTm1]EIJ87617.1 hypothetical protein NEQG_02164 [Nematocida parisii ERTm3]KAI5126688.1 hypothetical protein NEPAR03_0609 [Nematocida parisii]EIJ92845.1 hypothetical protein NEPG_02244 [Nematocida parisii ERTm1]KAI5129290.1 hypothetical protein NEPAR08_1534 [Nematocida parisii]KAI5142040.1 hypothetical protein NEPAR04_1396 [Nematocida parisii]|eukprot:XP_013060071.1 hypothetical protein NEPG_02244 [Nematocida parisii ERTm1]
MFSSHCRVIKRKLGRWTVYDYTGEFNPELYKYMRKMATLLPPTKNNSFLLDIESWYSITPVDLANKISQGVQKKYGGPVKVLDLFSGVGGNTVSFLNFGNTVHSIEIDYKKIRCLRHNIKECTDRGESQILHFSVYDPEVHSYLDRSYDVLMASPPWGGVDYKEDSDLALFNKCRILELEKIYSDKVGLRIYMLPRTISNSVFSLLNSDFAIFNGTTDRNRVVAKIIAVGDISGFVI